MQVKIDWDYKNTGKVAVAIFIMRGDFDAKLHWPIRYKYTIILINQFNREDNLVYSYQVTKEDLEKHRNFFKRSTENRNSGFGHPSFISKTEILENNCTKQDSITLHISVELLPPL